MDAHDHFVGLIERSDDLGDRLAQIAALIDLPVDTFFDEADLAEDASADFHELLRLWDAVGCEGRAEILACARAATSSPSRDGRA